MDEKKPTPGNNRAWLLEETRAAEIRELNKDHPGLPAWERAWERKKAAHEEAKILDLGKFPVAEDEPKVVPIRGLRAFDKPFEFGTYGFAPTPKPGDPVPFDDVPAWQKFDASRVKPCADCGGEYDVGMGATIHKSERCPAFQAGDGKIRFDVYEPYGRTYTPTPPEERKAQTPWLDDDTFEDFKNWCSGPSDYQAALEKEETYKFYGMLFVCVGVGFVFGILARSIFN